MLSRPPGAGEPGLHAVSRRSCPAPAPGRRRVRLRLVAVAVAGLRGGGVVGVPPGEFFGPGFGVVGGVPFFGFAAVLNLDQCPLRRRTASAVSSADGTRGTSDSATCSSSAATSRMSAGARLSCAARSSAACSTALDVHDRFGVLSSETISASRIRRR